MYHFLWGLSVDQPENPFQSWPNEDESFRASTVLALLWSKNSHNSHSLWTAVVYLNHVVFTTVLDRLFSSRLALAWELYGSFGICSYSKFWFCGLNEKNGAWVRFIVPSSFMRQDLSAEVFSLCFSSKFFILELLLFLSNFDPCWHPEMTKAAWEFWRKRSLYKLSFIQRSRTFASL